MQLDLIYQGNMFSLARTVAIVWIFKSYRLTNVLEIDFEIILEIRKPRHRLGTQFSQGHKSSLNNYLNGLLHFVVVF